MKPTMVCNIETILAKTKSELADLFSKAEAGHIPNVEAEGTVLIAPSTSFTPEIAKFINFFAWQGKVFNAEKMTLVNKITVFGLDAIQAHIAREPSWIDGKECVVLDYSRTSVVAHWVRDGICLIAPDL
jgi:hypothetical protein